MEVGGGAAVVEVGGLAGFVVALGGGRVVADAAGWRECDELRTIPGTSAATTPATSNIAARARVTRATTWGGFTKA